MAEKDVSEKQLADYSDVFADITNALIFQGERRVREDELLTTKDKSQYKADGKLHEQERDVSKIWRKKRINIAFLGMEHQTDIDEYMVLRVIGYDGAVYRSQYNKKKTKAYPVITLVLNFSEKRWDKAKKLSDIMEVPEELKPFFNDYEIHVFDIAYLSDEEVERFQSDFRIVADYFVQMRKDPDNYIPSQKEIKHVDEVLKLMKALTGDDSIEEIFNQMEEGAGRKSMVSAFKLERERGRAEGHTEGLTKGHIETLFAAVKNLMESLKCSREQAMDALKVSEEDRAILAEKFEETRS